MEKSKCETFIGFAIRARKCKIGVNACKTLKKAKLIAVCSSAGESTFKEAEKLAAKFSCPLLITKGRTLESMTHKDNAKVMAVTDAALSQAILKVKEEEFIERV